MSSKTDTVMKEPAEKYRKVFRQLEGNNGEVLRQKSARTASELDDSVETLEKVIEESRNSYVKLVKKFNETKEKLEQTSMKQQDLAEKQLKVGLQLTSVEADLNTYVDEIQKNNIKLQTAITALQKINAGANQALNE